MSLEMKPPAECQRDQVSLTNFFLLLRRTKENHLVIKEHLYGKGVNSLIQLFCFSRQITFCHLFQLAGAIICIRRP